MISFEIIIRIENIFLLQLIYIYHLIIQKIYYSKKFIIIKNNVHINFELNYKEFILFQNFSKILVKSSK